SPRDLTFTQMGAVAAGHTPILIRSCGDKALTLQAVRLTQLSGPGQAFSLANAPAPGTMLAPESCPQDPPRASFDLVFEPGSNGTYTARIDIDSDDPVSPTTSVGITATKQ